MAPGCEMEIFQTNCLCGMCCVVLCDVFACLLIVSVLNCVLWCRCVVFCCVCGLLECVWILIYWMDPGINVLCMKNLYEFQVSNLKKKKKKLFMGKIRMVPGSLLVCSFVCVWDEIRMDPGLLWVYWQDCLFCMIFILYSMVIMVIIMVIIMVVYNKIIIIIINI